MAISDRLKAFLTEKKVKFKSHKHPVAYTAQEIAAALHVSGRQLAKCVVVKTDKGLRLAVLPAVQLVDLKKLKSILRAKSLTLAREPDFKQQFPDVEVGAMSVFGNLYDIPVFVDKSLTTAEEIVCNAGTHTETIALRYRDFEKLVKPRVGAFGLSAAGAAARKGKKKKVKTKR